MSNKLALQLCPAPSVVTDGQSEIQAERVEGPTPASIASAKAAQLAERRGVTRLTGVRFTEDGRMLSPWGLSPFYLTDSEVDAALSAANAIAAAVYGPRGKRRVH